MNPDYPAEPDIFFNEDEVLRLLNVSPEELDRLVDNYKVIAVKNSREEILYPFFQFTQWGLNEKFSKIAEYFKENNLDGWYIVRWVLEDNQLLGRSPMEHILKELDFDDLINALKEDMDTKVTPQIRELYPKDNKRNRKLGVNHDPWYCDC